MGSPSRTSAGSWPAFKTSATPRVSGRAPVSDPSLIADLIRAGVDADLVQRVALELGRASAEREAIERRRQADRERQARRRSHVMSRDVTLQHVTTRDVTAAP
ncbi:protein of unknown function [Methylorubrum extorquens]|uniref:Uncharacterized protein n=1 Tax=Methylorubrum extorquens TaxID=408 RepID=A0A2N9AHG9_METEX|nr:protein of unknown function [Methylorubrum extorquens]